LGFVRGVLALGTDLQLAAGIAADRHLVDVAGDASAAAVLDVDGVLAGVGAD